MRILLFSSLLLGMVGLGLAQKPDIKNGPIKQTPANSGRAMFSEYCAACHGKGATGSGPAAPGLKVTPPDLTILARRNKGKFPAAYVANVILMGGSAIAHGSKEMPGWGTAFLSLNPHDEAIVEQRVANLTDYIESLQQK
jgi:mono/diheme cytochrome c family protein